MLFGLDVGYKQYLEEKRREEKNKMRREKNRKETLLTLTNLWKIYQNHR